MEEITFFKELCTEAVLNLKNRISSADMLRSCMEDSPGISTPELLGMRFNITTKKQVVEILDARGYPVMIEIPNIQESEPLKSMTVSSVYIGRKNDRLGVTSALIAVISFDELMLFCFDNNQRLIMFGAKGEEKLLAHWIVDRDEYYSTMYPFENVLMQSREDSSGAILDTEDENAFYLNMSPKIFEQFLEYHRYFPIIWN